MKPIFGLLAIRSGAVPLEGEEVTGKAPAQMLARGVTYVPQGRNLFPRLSVRHNLEIGGISAHDPSRISRRIDAVMEQFPILRDKADAQAATLSGGQQKQLEIARALLLEPRLMLVDEPSIGLSPRLVNETFDTLARLREAGVTILMVEQNARRALAISDYGIVLELGRKRMHDKAGALLEDPRIGQLFLGASLEEAES